MNDPVNDPRARADIATFTATAVVVIEHDDTPSGVEAKLARRRPPDLVPKLWGALMALYVGSGHGKAPLDLEGDRPQTIEKCLSHLHSDPLEAARRMLHVFEFWLYGPDPFWRTRRRNSALVATLLRSTEIGVRYTESAEWVWDGENRSAGPQLPLSAKQSNYRRQRDQLLREIEEEEQHGNEENPAPSDRNPTGRRVLQLTPGG